MEYEEEGINEEDQFLFFHQIFISSNQKKPK